MKPHLPVKWGHDHRGGSAKSPCQNYQQPLETTRLAKNDTYRFYEVTNVDLLSEGRRYITLTQPKPADRSEMVIWFVGNRGKGTTYGIYGTRYYRSFACNQGARIALPEIPFRYRHIQPAHMLRAKDFYPNEDEIRILACTLRALMLGYPQREGLRISYSVGVKYVLHHGG